MHSGRAMTETSPGRARWRRDARGEGAVRDNPFTLLGLPTRPGLSDDDVRAAWRRIAAATHPDREDGGDPARFGAVAAAYAMLRTGFGRGEALADLGLSGTAAPGGRHAHPRRPRADAPARAGRHRAPRPPSTGGPAVAERQAPTQWPQPSADTGPAGAPGPPRQPDEPRPAGGPLRWRPVKRPGGLTVRMVGAVAVVVLAVVILGWSPGVAGVLAGVLTWLGVTAGRAFQRRRSG